MTIIIRGGLQTFGPGHSEGHPEWCPGAPPDDPGHCGHWYDSEPCHRCDGDTFERRRKPEQTIHDGCTIDKTGMST